MDMVKMGSFLAELRKERRLTQAELGEKLGVTNKTHGGTERPVRAPEGVRLPVRTKMNLGERQRRSATRLGLPIGYRRTMLQVDSAVDGLPITRRELHLQSVREERGHPGKGRTRDHSSKSQRERSHNCKMVIPPP